MKFIEKEIIEQLNVPEAVAHLGKNALDSKHKPAVRYNYIQTLKTIKEYCNKIINEYERLNGRNR
jgi:hypothetical protein